MTQSSRTITVGGHLFLLPRPEPIDASVATDTVIIESGDLIEGAVTAQWRGTLTQRPDPAKVWATRRGRHLLGTTDPGDIDELLVDASGWLALLASLGDRGTAYRAEWPVGLPGGLTDDTVIASDRGDGNSHGPVVALTRTPAGWRADPVPAPPDQLGYGGFNWGYGGTGPGCENATPSLR